MKITVRKITAAILSALTALQLTACGKNGEEKRNTSPAEYVYRGKSAEISDEVKGDFEKFEYFNGKIYFFSENLTDEEKGSSEYYLNYAADDGSLFRSVLLAEGENIHLSPLSFSSEGKGYYTEVSKTEDGHSYALKEIDETGKETASKDITDIVESNTPELYPSEISVFGDIVYIADPFNVLAVRTDGTFAGAVTDIYGLTSVIFDKSGKAYAYLWSGAEYELWGIDISGGKLESLPELPFEGYSSTFISGNGSGCDFFVNDGTSLFAYNIGGEKTELLNWIAANISIMEVSDIFYIGDETFLCAGKSFPHGIPKISTVKKELRGDADRTELILAGYEYSINGFIENSAVRFNAANDKYRITVKKYSYDDDKLSADIISGKIPDILISDSYMPVDSYISKGLLADLYEFIDKDSGLDRSDFVPNLLSACETDGKLYRFTDKFKVYTVLGKTSVFGENMSLTTDRLSSIAARYPDFTETLPAATKEDVLRFAVELSGKEFIDFKNKTCSFNSESFIKMLEYAGTYKSSQDYEEYFNSFFDKLDTMYADESALLMLAYLSDYSDIYRFERTSFGEKVTALGFPCDGRTGTAFIIDSGFSISAKSKHKDGAWEFVRTLLLPEYQDRCDCFPVRKDSLEKSANTAMKYDPDRVNYAVVMLGQMAVTSGAANIGEPKREDIDRMNEVIASANGLMTYDSSIMDIVLEEAGSYFNGSKSAREAAELIQTRAALYLDEHS